MLPNLSIIIPFYNCKKYFTQCLDSVLSQESITLEVVLVNDGSTDGSEKIAEQYAYKDDRINLFNQSNMGIPIARNKGLELATGEYLLFIDADDYLAPNTLWQLYQTAKHHNLDILQPELYTIANGKIRSWGMHRVELPMSGSNYFMLMSGKQNMMVAPYMNLVKRAYWEQVGFKFDERLTRMQDFELYTKLIIKAKKIMNTSIRYYYYRIFSNAGASSERRNMHKLYQLYGIIIEDFTTFAQQEKLSPSMLNRLLWCVCFYASRWTAKGIESLPNKDRQRWNSFIRRYIFKNKGWLCWYSYYRYLRTFAKCQK